MGIDFAFPTRTLVIETPPEADVAPREQQSARPSAAAERDRGVVRRLKIRTYGTRLTQSCRFGPRAKSSRGIGYCRSFSCHRRTDLANNR